VKWFRAIAHYIVPLSSTSTVIVVVGGWLALVSTGRYPQ
jgi:hypothetical protein